LNQHEASPVGTIETVGSGLHEWVAEWYRALDRHDDISDVLPYLVDDGLVLRFPEGVYRGHDGFRQWYEAVTHRFFDEVHEVQRVVSEAWVGNRTSLQVVVNWQAKVWDPPQPNSVWLGFDAYQTWEVVRGSEGQPQVLTYVVTNLQAMPGSASL
jgi:hypothetical protein